MSLGNACNLMGISDRVAGLLLLAASERAMCAATPTRGCGMNTSFLLSYKE